MKKFKALILALTLLIAFGVTARTAKAEGEECKAAPAVAADLLEKAGISPRHGTGRDRGNYISDVALHMEPETDFDGVDKCDIDDYKMAVAQFLVKKGAAEIQDLFKANLESVVYNGTCGFFGSHIGDTLVFTFSNDIYRDDGVLLEVDFRGGTQMLWEGWGKTDWDVTGNVLTVTTTALYSNPRNVLGHTIESIKGLKDFIDNPVVVDRSVSVEEGTLNYTTATSGEFISTRYLPGEWDYGISITRKCDDTFVSGEMTLTDPNGDEALATIEDVKNNYPYWSTDIPNIAAVGDVTYFGDHHFMFLYANRALWIGISDIDYAPYWTIGSVYPGGDRLYDIHSQNTYSFDTTWF